MHKQAHVWTLNVGNGRSTSHSTRINFRSPSDIFYATAPYVALVFLVCVAYWYTMEAEDADLAATAAKSSNGPWARAYREAEGSRKQAIDMLVRCNIVSKEEFQSETVDNERIEEFCWVAVNMLMQQSVEAWVGSGEHAQKTFDHSFKASFPVDDSPPHSHRSGAVTIPPLNLPGNRYEQRPRPGQVYGEAASPPSDGSEGSSTTTSREATPPPNSLSFFEEAPRLPSEDALGSSLRAARSLPLHLLGPTPTVFSASGRGVRRAGRGPPGSGASGRGSSGSSRITSPSAPASGHHLNEGAPRARSPGRVASQPTVGRAESGTQVLDCASAPAAKAAPEIPTPRGRARDGGEVDPSATPVASATQLRGEVDRAG